MSKEVRVRVAEAKESDAGRAKARIEDKAMQALNIVAGDIISIEGKRTTAAVAWQAFREDQEKQIIRIDGLIRKNAEVEINEYVTVTKADVKEAGFVVLEPVDMRLSVDKDFIKYVKARLLEFPLVEGDSILIVILGSAIPFIVDWTEPRGIVKISEATHIQVLSHPKRGYKALSDKIGYLGDAFELIGDTFKEHEKRLKRLEIKLDALSQKTKSDKENN